VVSRQTPQKADNRTASIGGGQLEQMVNNGQTLDTLTPQEMAYLARQERNNGGVLPEDLYNAVYKNTSSDIDEITVTGYVTDEVRQWRRDNMDARGNYIGTRFDYFPSKKPDYVAPQITKISLGKVLTQALGIGSLPAAGAFGVAGVGIAATGLATKLPILNEAGLLALEVGAGDAIGGASILRAGGAVIGLGAAGLKSLDNLATNSASRIPVAGDAGFMGPVINVPENAPHYIPSEPLATRSVPGFGDLPLPHPDAAGPHTVLGARVGTDGTTVYRQTATFPESTWPKLDGMDVPFGRVDWTSHSYLPGPLHPEPHIHEFNYDFLNKQWKSGGAKPFFNF